MSTQQKGICVACGADTKDRRRAYCLIHVKDRRVHDKGRAKRGRGGSRYRRNKNGTPNRTDERQDGEAPVRRLFALRQRAEAGLPLFGRNERAKAE